MNSKNCLLDEIIYLSSPICKIAKVPHLVSDLDLRNIPTIISPFIKKDQFSPEGTGFLPSQCYVYQGACVLNSSIYQGDESTEDTKSWLAAGPRKHIYWNPSDVKAAIVTCGGLCPGLNVVIREIYLTLKFLYGVNEVYGIKYGY